MALGVHTECTKLWKLDDLALIVDSVESYIVDAVRAQHIKTGNEYDTDKEDGNTGRKDTYGC